MEDDSFVKITNAVYEVLDFLPDSDPLKNKAKEKALVILEGLTVIFSGHGWVSVKDHLSPEIERLKEGVVKDIEILESYLMVAKKQKWISDINFLIIANGYSGIKKHIGTRKAVTEKTSESSSVESNHEKSSTESFVNVSQDKKTERKTVLLPKLSTRQEKILQMLSKKRNAQVADIVEALPNVTKRTIRRDLDELLKKGRIVRQGQWNQVSYQINDRT